MNNQEELVELVAARLFKIVFFSDLAKWGAATDEARTEFRQEAKSLLHELSANGVVLLADNQMLLKPSHKRVEPLVNPDAVEKP